MRWNLERFLRCLVLQDKYQIDVFPRFQIALEAVQFEGFQAVEASRLQVLHRTPDTLLVATIKAVKSTITYTTIWTFLLVMDPLDRLWFKGKRSSDRVQKHTVIIHSVCRSERTVSTCSLDNARNLSSKPTILTLKIPCNRKIIPGFFVLVFNGFWALRIFSTSRESPQYVQLLYMLWSLGTRRTNSWKNNQPK